MQVTNTLKRTTDYSVKHKHKAVKPTWGEIIEMNDPPQNFRDAMLQQQAKNESIMARMLH